MPPPGAASLSPDDLLAVFRDAAAAVRQALKGLDDWGLAGTREGQYRSDLVADRAAIDVLDRAGLGILSEESGVHHPDRPLLVALDPVDGSTNASRHLPWWATSMCALDQAGPLAALVVNQATGTAFEATRGGGARRDGRPIAPSGALELGQSMIGLSGMPKHYLGWRQYRALGAAALDLCAVACGDLDGYIDCSVDAHAPWDYLGGLLVCTEAGATVADAYGRDLVARGGGDRRTPVAGATEGLLRELVAARST
ncbi:MAG: inositol monophosphatase family protein [Acidimicrobiales bacterium]